MCVCASSGRETSVANGRFARAVGSRLITPNYIDTDNTRIMLSYIIQNTIIDSFMACREGLIRWIRSVQRNYLLSR